MASPQTDVLIVGAGPTGLSLALELALHKVKFRIIDKEPTPSIRSRALVIQSRTLELLRRHGISEALTAAGNSGIGARIYVDRRKGVDIDTDNLDLHDTAFPQPLWISQAKRKASLPTICSRSLA